MQEFVARLVEKKLVVQLEALEPPAKQEETKPIAGLPVKMVSEYQKGLLIPVV